MDDEGQAYIATAVVLGALLVAMFAAPAITHSSLAAGTQADSTSRRVFFDEVDDVLRVLEQAVQDAAPEATVNCTRTQDEVQIPGEEEGNTTTVYDWTCDEDADCGGSALTSAVDDAIAALRPLVRASLVASATLQPDCVATCTEATDIEEAGFRPAPIPEETAIDLRLSFGAPIASAAFNETAFGGPRDVAVACEFTFIGPP